MVLVLQIVLQMNKKIVDLWTSIRELLLISKRRYKDHNG